MEKIEIKIYKIFYIVKDSSGMLKQIIKPLLDKLTTYTYVYNKQYRRQIRQKDKEYYVYNPFDKTYRFHISTAKDFMLLLGSSGITRDHIDMSYSKVGNVKPLNLTFDKNFKLRDYQVDYSKVLLDPNALSALLVDLDTGYGKTLISMYSIVKLNLRTMIVVLPKYIEKWISDVKKYTDVSDEDIYLVQGGDSIVELMNDNDITYKFIIVSMRTLSNFITEYETNPSNCSVSPQQFIEHLGVGVMLNDETHQHFHALVKICLYANVMRMIGLSATLDSNQKDIKEIYNIIFKPNNRISNLVEYVPYIHTKAISYRLTSNRGIKYKLPQGYNHNLFEQSILRNHILLREYTDMIKYYVEESYISRRTKGDKLLIFLANVTLCTVVANRLREWYPDIDVRRYVEDDPYENIIEGEITVSTNLSAGTAIDIPGLISVIQTVSISSLQANLQAFGRLRRIPDKEVWYYYLYTQDIPNQYKMHKDRKSIIENRSKEFVYDDYIKYLKV